MKAKRLASLALALALTSSLLCVPANAASFALRTAPGMMGSERVYTTTVRSFGTSRNEIDVAVSSYYGDGRGNVHGTCKSHRTSRDVIFDDVGRDYIKVTEDVVVGTPMTVVMSLQNVVPAETLRASGTVG